MERRLYLIVVLRIQEERCQLHPSYGTLAQFFLTFAQLCEGSWDYSDLGYMCFVDLEKCTSYIVGGTKEV